MSGTIECGNPPVNLGVYPIEVSEMMYYLYLPIKLPGEKIALPENLKQFRPLLYAALANQKESFLNKYIYITTKTMWVGPGSPGNRPGWHIDGFASGGDVSYVWCNMNPTEYAVQEFSNVSDDDQQSMLDIESQINHNKIQTWEDYTLLRLDEKVVHRVNPNPKCGIRSFVKITFSNHQFRNKGNSHNYLLNYDWDMKTRNKERNLDHG